MMMLRVYSAIAVLLVALPAVAQGNCHERVHWTFGRSTTSTWHVSGGAACSMTNTRPQHIAKIDIDSNAKNGVVGKSGPFGVVYKPNFGFKGSDSFSFSITSNESYDKGAGYVAHVLISS